MLNESPTAEKVSLRIVEKLLGSKDPTEANANTVDPLIQRMAQQHGESPAEEDIQQITQAVHTLRKQGARFTT
ncbi:MAG: hypothetical protein ACK4FK_18680, partial [Ferrovibrio sp.]|uniref:hypothetical protein n=1 Tax=Ferrovibrio sp. TaxID=1917215 RepID=UPI00391BAEC7